MITICTPTFNRGYILRRPFESLKNQTCKDFVWLIIDDGSSDNSHTEVEKFKNEDPGFEIEYHFKRNGGRHTALNYSYQFIQTEWVLNLDSDDALLPNAVETIYRYINIFEKNDEKYKRFWQISFRCVDSQTKDFVGEKYDLKINTLSGKKQHHAFMKVKGEMHNLRRVKILRKFPFPEYKDTKFVFENTVWDQINSIYDSFCTNDVISYWFQDSPDSLNKGKMHSSTWSISALHYYLFAINNELSYFFWNHNVRASFYNIPRYAIRGGGGPV